MSHSVQMIKVVIKKVLDWTKIIVEAMSKTMKARKVVTIRNSLKLAWIIFRA